GGWSARKSSDERRSLARRGEAMKHARVAYRGTIQNAVEKDGFLQLSDGRMVTESDVVWLPPIQPQTVFTLGLNYADHAKELSFTAPKEPLVFLKGPN